MRAAATAAPTAPAAEENGGSKLTVGPNIKLKGVEITDCDTLVVEGTVEATMNSRVIKIAEQGRFTVRPRSILQKSTASSTALSRCAKSW
jgi:hypothetical protein